MSRLTESKTIEDRDKEQRVKKGDSYCANTEAPMDKPAREEENRLMRKN
jgi:hypothetical protein